MNGSLVRKMDTNNGWTEGNEKIAKRWSRNAIIRKWLHYQSALFFRKLDLCLGVPAIFLTSAIGVSLLGAGTTSDDSVTSIIQFICAGIAFISAGLQGVHMYIDAGQQSQRHLQSSVLYDGVHHEVEIEINLPMPNRQEWRWFMNVIDKRYITTAKVAPVIPGRYFKYKTSDIVYGKLAEELNELDLQGDTYITGANDEFPTLAKTPDGPSDTNPVLKDSDQTHESTSSNQSKSVQEHVYVSENHEYVTGLRLQQEIQMELAKVREKQKLAREQMQGERLFRSKPMMRPRMSTRPGTEPGPHDNVKVEEIIVEMPVDENQ